MYYPRALQADNFRLNVNIFKPLFSYLLHEVVCSILGLFPHQINYFCIFFSSLIIYIKDYGKVHSFRYCQGFENSNFSFHSEVFHYPQFQYFFWFRNMPDKVLFIFQRFYYNKNVFLKCLLFEAVQQLRHRNGGGWVSAFFMMLRERKLGGRGKGGDWYLIKGRNVTVKKESLTCISGHSIFAIILFYNLHSK